MGITCKGSSPAPSTIFPILQNMGEMEFQVVLGMSAL